MRLFFLKITTNHFSHCTFVGSSWWCKLVPHKKQFSLEWLMKIRSRTELYDRRVLFWMINSDPQSRGDGTRDHHGWWTLAIMINDLSICPHYNISDRRKVHSIIETSDRSVSSPWLYWSDGPRARQLFPWWFITTILQVLFDVWLWAVFVIIVFFCFNCRHHPGRRMVNGHISQPMKEKWLITFKMPNHYCLSSYPDHWTRLTVHKSFHNLFVPFPDTKWF